MYIKLRCLIILGSFLKRVRFHFFGIVNNAFSIEVKNSKFLNPNRDKTNLAATVKNLFFPVETKTLLHEFPKE